MACLLIIGGLVLSAILPIRGGLFGLIKAAPFTARRGSNIILDCGGVARFARFPLSGMPKAACPLSFSLFALSSV